MNDYQPRYRRPIASMFRRTANAAVNFCIHHGIHPDSVSYSSIVAALGASLFFWQSGHTPWFVVPAAAFCYLRLWFNMLDGMVALGSGQATLHGEIVNELPDRISDILIFVGVAHSGLCSSATLGYWAALLAVLTAYVGILGQAVGVQREFSGVMTKPWRMVTLHIGSWTALVTGHISTPVTPGGLKVMDITMILIVIGCVQTIIIRLHRILKSLRAMPREPKAS